MTSNANRRKTDVTLVSMQRARAMAVPRASRRNAVDRGPRAPTYVAPLAIARVSASAHADVDAMAKQVAKQRGLPLKKKVEQEVIDRDQLRARLLELAAQDKTQTETRAEGLALARWGMIPRDTDYLALMVDLLTDQIAGYYDPLTKKLTISRSADADPDWSDMVLAHELDHALQDQSFDLAKFETVPDTEGDAALAR